MIGVNNDYYIAVGLTYIN